MWPVLLDMTIEESMQCLRNLELEAYAHLVSALRAQGPLNPDKRKLLKDTSVVLNITQDRHKAEIRRAINDEKLNTIAYHVSGLNESLDEWAQEGRRTVPLIPRSAPQTVYSAIADDVADCANQNNKQLPPPALTERKRTCTTPSSPQLLPETTNNINNNNNNNSKLFRINDLTKIDENSKKRKLSSSSTSSAATTITTSPSSTIISAESSNNFGQHLLHAPAMKINRCEQIYRHRTKQMLKEQSKLMRKYAPTINGPTKHSNNEETIEQIQNEINNSAVQQQSNSNENQAQQRPKLINPIKTTNLIFKPTVSTNPGPSSNNNNNSDNTDNQQHEQRICSNVATTTTVLITTATTTITTATLPRKLSPLPQKLIVVSNPQTLQQTKSVSIPLVKNISMRNFEKFKIVTTNSHHPQQQQQQQLNCSNVVANLNSLKHKVVTVKTNPLKKVIPLSQLLNSKGGIKVLPIGGKIIGKTLTTTPTTVVTTSTTTNPVYIVNTLKTNVQQIDNSNNNNNTNNNNNNNDKENGKSAVLGDILKASGVTHEDFDTQIEEFHIPNNNHLNNREIVKNVEATATTVQDDNQTVTDEVIIDKDDKSDFIIVQGNSEIIEETPTTTSQDNVEIVTTNSDGN